MRITVLLVLTLTFVHAMGQTISKEEEEKLKKWVLENKLIELSSDTIFINGRPTYSLQTVYVDSAMISISIPAHYDSMKISYGRFYREGQPLIAIAEEPSKQTTTRFDIRYHQATQKPKIAALFVNAYHNGNRHAFCRLIAQKPGM